MRYQGELNVDVLEHDATEKLQRWFDDRRKEKLWLDISKELIQIIDESWVTTVSLSYFKPKIPSNSPHFTQNMAFRLDRILSVRPASDIPWFQRQFPKETIRYRMSGPLKNYGVA